MALKIVTGKTGVTHVTSDDEAALNAGIMGEGSFVLPTGSKFKATALSANSVKIEDGDGVIQGKLWRITPNSYETVAIENGQTGYNRNDLIVAKYTRTSAGIEAVSLAVLKGEATTGTASDPVYTEGDMRANDSTVYQALYRVKLIGLAIDSITAIYTVSKSMVDEATRATTAETNAAYSYFIYNNSAGTYSTVITGSATFYLVIIRAGSGTYIGAVKNNSNTVTELFNTVTNGVISVYFNYALMKLTVTSTAPGWSILIK